MSVLGVEINKISVNKLASPKGKVDVNQNTDLREVKTTDLVIGTVKQKALIIGFKYTADFEPKIANITIEGELVWVEKPESITAAFEKWQKAKTLERGALESIMNAIFARATMQCILLARELNLPLPIQFPRISSDNVK